MYTFLRKRVYLIAIIMLILIIMGVLLKIHQIYFTEKRISIELKIISIPRIEDNKIFKFDSKIYKVSDCCSFVENLCYDGLNEIIYLFKKDGGDQGFFNLCHYSANQKVMYKFVNNLENITIKNDPLYLIMPSALTRSAWHIILDNADDMFWMFQLRKSVRREIIFIGEIGSREIWKDAYGLLFYAGMAVNYTEIRHTSDMDDGISCYKNAYIGWVRRGVPKNNAPKDELKGFAEAILDNFNLTRREKRNKKLKVMFQQRQHCRNIVNIKDLKNIAKKKGLNTQIAVLEHYPSKEQMMMHYNADILVAPHGSANVYMMFMPKNSIEIEIMPYNFRNTDYKSWCRWTDIQYNVLHTNDPKNIVVCRHPEYTLEQKRKINDYLDQRDQNITVDESEFNTILDKAINLLPYKIY